MIVVRRVVGLVPFGMLRINPTITNTLVVSM